MAIMEFKVKVVLTGLALMLHISPISTSTTISTKTNSTTNDTTQSTSIGTTKLPTILASTGTTAPKAASISGPTPTADEKTTAAPPPATTTIVPYNCKSGICKGNETCINSSDITLTCSIAAAEQGCFRKQNDTHFEVGCRPCDTGKNTVEDWCCKGKSDCNLGSMPPLSGNANMDTNVSRSFAILATMALVLFVI